MAVFRKLTSYLVIPLGWTIITIILLCLPGSAFPSQGVFGLDIPHLDKVIHVILFGTMVVLWCMYFLQKVNISSRARKIIVFISFATIVLGICMEFIQLNFVPNRAFDIGDIWANSLSAIGVGSFFLWKQQSK